MANCIIITGGTWNKEEWSKIQRSVGPYRIATSLEQQGYSTFVFDYIINFSTEEIKKVLAKHLTEETLWVGFSSTFFWFPEEGKFSGNGDILKLKEMYWTYDDQIAELFKFVRENSKAKIINICIASTAGIIISLKFILLPHEVFYPSAVNEIRRDLR